MSNGKINSCSHTHCTSPITPHLYESSQFKIRHSNQMTTWMQPFRKLKYSTMAHRTPLQYFQWDHPITIQANASKHGLGACLIQNGKPIAFTLKSLVDTETRYANIEHEYSAVTYVCIHLCPYLYGCFLTIESEHKLLETITLKNLTTAHLSPENSP